MIKTKPFLKWAGGKRQLLTHLKMITPDKFNNYFEPFVGAGALFFELNPTKAYINDLNEDLINTYVQIKERPVELITILEIHKANNSKTYFETIRMLDRSSDYSSFSNLQKAARFIYLNKVSYNGLYRVNKKNQFNVPYGNYKNPNICDSQNIKNVSRVLNENDISITSEDFSYVLDYAKRGDLVYFDPPYDPLSKTSSFKEYHSVGFDKKEQTRLKEVCDILVSRGVHVIVSNSNTEFINSLYSNKLKMNSVTVKYEITKINAKRNINSNPAKRINVEELLIKGYIV